MEVPTRQEMFDRAVRGLASQGWQQAIVPLHDGGIKCMYLTPNGLRCAWGWVDPEATACLDPSIGGIKDLHTDAIGIAAALTPEDARFAQDLQSCHDDSRDNLHDDFKMFADDNGLAWPKDVP